MFASAVLHKPCLCRYCVGASSQLVLQALADTVQRMEADTLDLPADIRAEIMDMLALFPPDAVAAARAGEQFSIRHHHPKVDDEFHRAPSPPPVPRAPAIPQPPGWDWDWDKALHWRYTACEEGWDLQEPYDYFCDETEGLYPSEVRAERDKLRALATEPGLHWTPLAMAESTVVHVDKPMLRIRWGWEAAGDAVRVEASTLLSTRYGPIPPVKAGETAYEKGYAVFVRDARPPAGPFIAAVINQGCHPTVLTSRWRVENSDGSTFEGLFDGPPFTGPERQDGEEDEGPEESGGRKWEYKWEHPYVPEHVEVTAPRLLRRAAVALYEYTLYQCH